jgi:hypothetical protein
LRPHAPSHAATQSPASEQAVTNGAIMVRGLKRAFDSTIKGDMHKARSHVLAEGLRH